MLQQAGVNLAAGRLAGKVWLTEDKLRRWCKQFVNRFNLDSYDADKMRVGLQIFSTTDVSSEAMKVVSQIDKEAEELRNRFCLGSAPKVEPRDILSVASLPKGLQHRSSKIRLSSLTHVTMKASEANLQQHWREQVLNMLLPHASLAPSIQELKFDLKEINDMFGSFRYSTLHLSASGLATYITLVHCQDWFPFMVGDIRQVLNDARSCAISVSKLSRTLRAVTLACRLLLWK